MPGFFAKVSCGGRLHDWDEWHYVRSSACEQQKACKRGCGKVESRTSHTYGVAVYTVADSCRKVSTCSRCGDATSKVEHAGWSDWAVSDPRTCLETRGCQRCAASETRNNHNFGPAQYKQPHSCLLVSQCSKCHVWQDRGTDHERLEWRFDYKGGCSGADVCPRCGFQTNRGTKHDYEFRYRSKYACDGCDTCVRCGTPQLLSDTRHPVRSGKCPRCNKYV
jgi:hypothetical protein